MHFAPADPERPDSAPPPQDIPLEQVVDFVTELANPGNRREVTRAAMQAPIGRLRSGMVLVDTPGVGSINPAHTAATRAFLPNADAILFVCSAVQPLSTVELDFLADALEQCPIVLTAVTMMDRVVAPEPVIAEARSRIATVAGALAEDLLVVGVSSLRKRKGLASGDEAMVAASGFAALEAELWEGLGATCGAAQLGQALDGLDAAVADGESPLLNELAALENDGELARIDEELRDAQSKIKELRSDGSAWRRNLAEELEVSSRAVRNRLTTDFEAARDRVKADLQGDEALAYPNTLMDRASATMVDAVNRANSGLAALVADVADRYARTTSVALTASGVETPPLDPRLGEVEALEARASSGFATFRSGWSGGVAGAGAATMLAAAASIIFPLTPLAILAAGAVGQVLGWLGGKRHQEQMEQSGREKAQRQHLRDQVLPKMDSAKRQAERDFADKLRDVTRVLTSALDDHLTASAESLAESVSRLQAARKRTAEDRAARRRDLQTRQARYAELHASLDGLRVRVAGLARRRRAA